MKIALLGYGKMGTIIDEIATNRGHEIVARLKESPKDIQDLNGAEVAIEFSQPEAAFTNICFCLAHHIPVVSGTTGWLDRKPEADEIAKREKTPFLYGSNFSLGVNLFFALNEKLAQLMAGQPYIPQLEEIHHTHKKDAPSGTAITLAEGILPKYPQFESWKLGETEASYLGIEAVREDEVPGTHSVFYRSEVDEIEIKHTAYNRAGFALGAVVAAEWIMGKEGVFTMRDVLDL